MGIPARGWALVLGKPVHTGSWGEGRRAGWHREVLGSEERLPLRWAPLSLGCQPATHGWEGPEGTSTPGPCCHHHCFAQSLPQTKWMPFCNIPCPKATRNPPSLSVATVDLYLFVCQHCLDLNSCFPFLCVYPLLYLKKVTVSPLGCHSLGDGGRSWYNGVPTPPMLLVPRLHTCAGRTSSFSTTADNSAQGRSCPSPVALIHPHLLGRLWLIYTTLAFVFCIAAWYLCFLVTPNKLICPGLSLPRLFRTDKLPAYSGNSCY